MEQFESLLTDLKLTLKRIDEMEQTTVEKGDQSVLVCYKYLNRLKALAMAKGFASDEEEIYFFKFQKPLVTSKLLYYAYLSKLESSIGFYDKQSLLKYYRLYLKKLARFGKKNKTFIYYYRSGNTSLDDKFFKRSGIDLKILSTPLICQFDAEFSTSHDHKVAKLLAKEAMAKYVSNLIEGLLHPKANEDAQEVEKSPFTWTGPKVAFVELSYGLFLTKHINHGNMRIGEFQKALQRCFNIEVDDPSRKFTEIKDRKRDLTKYLDQMAYAVKVKIQSENDNASNDS